MMVSQNNEISKLANTIKDLNSAIISLTETITSLKSSVTKYTPTSAQEADATTNIPVKRTVDDRSMSIHNTCFIKLTVYNYHHIHNRLFKLTLL